MLIIISNVSLFLGLMILVYRIYKLEIQSKDAKQKIENLEKEIHKIKGDEPEI